MWHGGDMTGQGCSRFMTGPKTTRTDHCRWYRLPMQYIEYKSLYILSLIHI